MLTDLIPHSKFSMWSGEFSGVNKIFMVLNDGIEVFVNEMSGNHSINGTLRGFSS